MVAFDLSAGVSDASPLTLQVLSQSSFQKMPSKGSIDLSGASYVLSSREGSSILIPRSSKSAAVVSYRSGDP